MSTTNGKHKKRIGFLHYSLPPAIAGVEMVIRDHARILSTLGYKVYLLGATGKKFRSDITVQLARSFHPKNKNVVEIQNQLTQTVPSEFTVLKNRYRKILQNWIQKNKIETVIVHNVLSRHYNLALTAAIVDLAAEMEHIKFISWVHDASFIDTFYTKLDPSLQTRFPWSLISTMQKHFEYVTVSKTRKEELLQLYGKNKKIQVISNGLDINKMLPLTKQIRLLFKDIHNRQADYVGVIPVRIAQRKNIEYAIEFAKAARDSYGKKIVFIITGATHQQKSNTNSYFDKLKSLINEYKLGDNFIFLYQHRLTNTDLFDIYKLHIRDLYLVTDFLFFPSFGEGFGLPLIEAGFMRMPIFASNLKVFKEVGNGFIQFMNLTDPVETNVSLLLEHLKKNKATLFHKVVLGKYDLEKIVGAQLTPLL